MQHEFWENKWKLNDIRFHLPDVNALLIAAFSNVTPCKVLVPLCGKSVDMQWLASRGHQVIGVELSEIACLAFFTENNIPYDILDKEPFSVYKSKNIEIWCGDIFKLPIEASAGVSAIYDRAALIALPESIRLSYTQFITNIIKSDALDMLLITIEYPDGAAAGPPFSISPAQVAEYYSNKFNIKQLALPEDYISVFTDNPKFTGVTVMEAMYWLHAK